MTAEKIDNLCRYANVIYNGNPNRLECRGESFEDFKQNFLLCALEHEDYSPALLLKAVRFSKMCYSEAILYRISEMEHFSDLIPEGADYDIEWIETICGAGEEFDISGSWDFIKRLAEVLFPNKIERQELFLDYMCGMSIGGGTQRDIREVLFHHRFEILNLLRNEGFIGLRDYEKYLILAKELTVPAKVKKQLRQTSDAIACRKYYEAHKEYFSEKAKRYNKIKRQERQTAD